MTHGIHHITAISSDPQRTYDFYAKILGLRLVKKTVNQDDPETYHLFFGDRFGHPGMDLTFFTFQPVHQGRRGNGLVTKIGLNVPLDSLRFWRKRFTDHAVLHDYDEAKNRIQFYDADDQRLELIGVDEAEMEAADDIWATDEITEVTAIRSFYSATLQVEDITLVEPILTIVLGYTKIGTTDNIHFYRLDNSKRGAYLEVEETPEYSYGLSGAGTVHHIAFRAKDDMEELAFRDKLRQIGLRPTEVIDRFYFKSVYFRTPAGILFEIATDKPGFTADESEDQLGKKLALPPFLESERAFIEANLKPIKTE